MLPKPVIVYPGGKYRLRNKILCDFPISPTRFVEPFIGGGSVTVAMGLRISNIL